MKRKENRQLYGELANIMMGMKLNDGEKSNNNTVLAPRPMEVEILKSKEADIEMARKIRREKKEARKLQKMIEKMEHHGTTTGIHFAPATFFSYK